MAKKKKKRKLPPALKAYQICRKKVGAEPFKKMSPTMKAEARACMRRELAR